MKVSFRISLMLPLLFLWRTFNGQTLDFSWSISLSGVANESINHIVTDSEGYVWMAVTTEVGFAFNTIDGDVLTSEPSTLVRINSSGEILWAKPIEFQISAMDFDYESEHVIIAGTYTGTVDLDPGVDVFFANTSEGAINGFITKLNSDGSATWINILNSDNSIFPQNIEHDSSGNIILLLFCFGSCDLDPEDGLVSINTSFPDEGAFVIARYNIDGEFSNEYHFIQEIFTLSNTQMELNQAGQVLVSGITFSNIDFDPDNSEAALIVNPIYQWNAFVLQLNMSLEYQWHLQLEGDEVWPVSIATYDQDWSLIVNFLGTIDIASGPQELFVLGEGDLLFKINQEGQVSSWIQFEPGVYSSSSVFIDNTLCISGQVYGEVDIDPGPGTQILNTVQNSPDGILLFFDENHNYLSHEKMVGVSYDKALDIVHTNNSELYVSGTYFGGTFQAHSEGIVHPDQALDNAFLVKYDLTTSVMEKPESYLKIYPNPASQSVFIYNPQNSPLICHLYTATGLDLDRILLSSGTNCFGLDHLNSGVYYFTIEGETNSTTRIIVL